MKRILTTAFVVTTLTLIFCAGSTLPVALANGSAVGASTAAYTAVTQQDDDRGLVKMTAGEVTGNPNSSTFGELWNMEAITHRRTQRR